MAQERLYAIGTTVYVKGYPDPEAGTVTEHIPQEVGTHGGFMGGSARPRSRTVTLHRVQFASGDCGDYRPEELTTRKPRI